MALFTKSALSRVALKKNFSESSSYILRNASAKFSKSQMYDIFLSHSYSDADDILRIKQEIEDIGASVYVDWIEDAQLNRSKVDKGTAETLRNRMDNCNSLFYVASGNSALSKWMPWELGYFDALKKKVAILPILESDSVTNVYNGQEYLGLYPYVAKDKTKEGSMALWIHETEKTYVSFSEWLKGKQPTAR